MTIWPWRRTPNFRDRVLLEVIFLIESEYHRNISNNVFEMNSLGFFVAILINYIASNGWKPDEGNDLKSLIMGICLGKTQNRCILH